MRTKLATTAFKMPSYGISFPLSASSVSSTVFRNSEKLSCANEVSASKLEINSLLLLDRSLPVEEIAFYDALTKPQAVKDFYDNDQLVAITKEMTEMLRNNRTVDWQKKETARAKMRSMVKRLLKKYKYPPEGQEEALETVISQCEMWTDNSLL